MKKTLISLFALLALVVAGFIGVRQFRPDTRPDMSATKPAPTVTTPAAPTTIEFAASDIGRVENGTIRRFIPVTGSLKAVNQALLKAKIAGEVKSLMVREGMPVRAGQIIAEIDSLDASSRAKEREATLRSADAQLDQAKRVLENNRALLAKNFISQSAFDNSQSAHDVAVATREAAAQQLTQSRKALSDTKVISPISGVVYERFVQPGEKLSVDARIVSVIDLSRMEIEAAIPSTDIGKIVVGQPIELSVEGIEQLQTGKVVRIAPSTQAGTRSIPIYIALENRNAQIRSGMFAQGQVSTETRKDVMVVPLASVRETAGRNFVYVVENGKLAEREVKVGLRDEKSTATNGSSGVAEITQGLKLGDVFVQVNLGPLNVGASVGLTAVTKKP